MPILTRAWLRRLATAVVALLLPLLVLEAAARIALDGEPPAPLITAPLETSPNLSITNVFAFDPDLFWRLLPGLDVDALPWADRTTPSGYRGVDDPTVSPGVPRIVALGDSCTYGFGVPHDAAWPAQLQAGGGFDVVNAGVPGYSTYQGGLRWAEIAARTAPDVLVVEFGINDANVWPANHNGGIVLLTDAERARHVRAIRMFQRSAFLGWLFAQRVQAPPRAMVLSDQEIRRGAPRVPVHEFETRLRALADAAQRTVLLRWPKRRELDPRWSDPTPAGRDIGYAEAIRRVAGEGHTLIDVADEFRASGLAPGELFVDGVHASRAGNAVVAAAVRRVLEEHSPR